MYAVDAVPDLIEVVGDADVNLSADAGRALQRITSQRGFGLSVEQETSWPTFEQMRQRRRDWWRANEQRVRQRVAEELGR
jgi:hypothetical protein